MKLFRKYTAGRPALFCAALCFLPVPGGSVQPAQAPASPQKKITWLNTLSGIGGITVSPDGGRLYIAYGGNKDGAPIEEYSLTTRKPIRTFHFEEKAGHSDVVISKNGRYIYTTNYYFTHISRIDLSPGGGEIGREAGGVRESVWAGDLDATPDRKLLLVTLGRDGRNGRTEDLENDQVSIFDIEDDAFKLVGEVKLPDELTGHKIGFSPDSRFAYVVTFPRKSPAPRLYEISLEKPFRVMRWLEFPDGALQGVAATDDKVFVSDADNKKVWIVDRKGFKVQGGVSLGGSAPGVLLISPKLDILYALAPAIRTLWAINTQTGAVINKLKGLRRNASDLELAPNGASLLVSHGGEEGGVAMIKLPLAKAPPAEAVVSKEKTIVFSSDRDGSYQIYTMNQDGSVIDRLTRTNSTERSPRWSPDGSRIAFISDLGGPPRVCIMNADGTGRKTLKNTDPGFRDVNSGASLDWSPDGTKLVFVNAKNTAIRLIGADGTGLKTLIAGVFGKGYGAYHGVSWRWARDSILFNASQADWGYYQDVFSINPGTGELTRVTDEWGKYAHSGAPALSPDGAKIAVAKQPGERASSKNIFIINRADKDFTILTRADDIAAAPRWSADGGKIVFCSGTQSKKHIRLMNADGSEQKQLTDGDGDDVEPDMRQAGEGEARVAGRQSAAIPGQVSSDPNYPVVIKMMPEIPAAIYNLFSKDKKDGGLGGCVMNVQIENRSAETAAFKISAAFEEMSPERREVSVLPGKSAEICLNPALTAALIKKVSGTKDQRLSVEVTTINPETGSREQIVDYSKGLALYPYDHFFPEITDAGGQYFNLLNSLVSWITPGDRNIELMYSSAAQRGNTMSPPIMLIGPQPKNAFAGSADNRSLADRDADYLAQIKLVYDVLKTDYQLKYFDSATGDEVLGSQRINYPVATLRDRKGGNCVELAVLFASLLEKLRLNPIIVLLFKEKHALVGWRVGGPGGERYHLLDTNYFGQDFAKALENGDSRLPGLGLTVPADFKDGVFEKNNEKGKPISRILNIEALRQKYPASPYVPD